MKTVKKIFFILLLISISQSKGLSRTFEDQFGRIIKADLISHTGISSNEIKISKDGKHLNVKISLFSEKDQKFIRNWMKETPPTIDYVFRIEATLKQLGSFKNKSDYIYRSTSRSKTKTNAYQIKLTNLTRQTVKDLRVEYRIVKEGRSGRYEFQRGHKEIIDPMRYNQDVVLTTTKSELDSYRSSYSSYSYKEVVLGVLIRVFDKQGKLVTDWRSSNTKIAKITWEEIDSYFATRRTSSSRSRPRVR